MPEMFEDFLQADVIPLQMPELEDSVELLFIHSHDDLIEKTLGEGESINVIKDAIIGFTDKVSFLQIDATGTNIKGFVRVKGPGILYIETSRNTDNGLATTLSP